MAGKLLMSSVRRATSLGVSIATLVSPIALANDTPDSWALRGAKLYTEPESKPIEDGVVLVRGRKIVAVGRSREVSIPQGTHVSSCSGGVVTAGFQNSHVHFISQEFNDARGKSDRELA